MEISVFSALCIALIQMKVYTNREAHLAESICKTHSKTENMEPDELIIQPHIFDCIVNCFFRNVLFIKPKLQVEVKQII